MAKPTVKGWGRVRETIKVFPGADIYFDLIDSDGNVLDAAVVKHRETRQQFVERIMDDFEWVHGKPIPPGCKLVYSGTFG